ncbi:MAG: DUF1015 domain-containing protein [Actinomycetota bacterium]|nr:DUF1015 domain-containing protein [Actinomycetota bacterium]
MAEIKPFRGIRYNQSAIGDLSLVVAPPYDVISEKERSYYYNLHPYNVIRLILNHPLKTDNPGDCYRRAANFFKRWLSQRILVRDSEPAIYIYRQRCIVGDTYRECTGLVCRVKIEDFSSGNIFPHEEIMPKPFEDRMLLLENVQANLSMVHALYSDPQEKLKESILKGMEKFPAAQFQTRDGVAHDLWYETEERFIKQVCSFLSKKALYIADGHHRYQTALEYSKRLKEEGKITDEEDPRNYVMMWLVELENPGLTILPVHRVIASGGACEPACEKLMSMAEKWFEIEKLEGGGEALSGQVYDLLRRLGSVGEGKPVFGLYLGPRDGFRILTWNNKHDPAELIEGDKSPYYKRLDVSVLHELLLRDVLGIPEDGPSIEKNIFFVKDAVEAANMVESGKGLFAFFLRPPKAEEVKLIAEQGEKMPQKSTYFFPKPCSGLVINSITEW